jgi:hypothetical protein
VDEQSVKLLCDEVIALPPTPEEAGTATAPAAGAVARASTAPRSAPRALPEDGSVVRGVPHVNGEPFAASVHTPVVNGAADRRPVLRVRVSTIDEIDQLERYLREHPGPRRVCAHVVSGDGEHVVPVRSGAHDVEELQQSLEQLFGEGNVWEE